MLPRWTFLNRFFQFWSDPELRTYYLDYKAVDYDEVLRKREVCRKAILRGRRVESFTRKQGALNQVIRYHERRRRRQELPTELIKWTTWVGLLIGLPGLVAAAVWWPPFSAWLLNVFKALSGDGV